MYLTKTAIRDLARLSNPSVQAVRFNPDSITLFYRPFQTEIDILKADVDTLIHDFTNGAITKGFEHLEALNYEAAFGGDWEPCQELSEMLEFISSCAVNQAKYAQAADRRGLIQHRRAA